MLGSIFCAIGKALKSLFGVSGVERASPSDFIPEQAVIAWVDYLPYESMNIGLKQKPKVWIPMIPDTNSMDGVFDYGNNNILIAGADEADHKTLIDFISVGDVAVYQASNGGLIIHRIVKIDNDSSGKYFRFKGDNNIIEDSDKVRENQIQWVSIGTIY